MEKERKELEDWVSHKVSLAAFMILQALETEIKKVAGSYRDMLCETIDIEYSAVINKYAEFHCSAF